MQEAAESEVLYMKYWSLENKKYYKRWSEYIKIFMNIGHDNATAQLLATRRLENEKKS